MLICDLYFSLCTPRSVRFIEVLETTSRHRLINVKKWSHACLLIVPQWNSLILIQRSPAGSERGLPFARDGIRTSHDQADAWNQDWEWMGRHWGATLISEKII